MCVCMCGGGAHILNYRLIWAAHEVENCEYKKKYIMSLSFHLVFSQYDRKSSKNCGEEARVS